MSWRIGAVSYLNTKPLIYGLRERLPQAELLLDLPSRLADRLQTGDLDVALIPSVEFLRQPELALVSDACIACRGAVRSVRLLFRKSPDQVRTLALDEGSRTSAALAQALLVEHFRLRPELQLLPIGVPFDNSQADALLVIGDRAMDVDTTCYTQVWDLGQVWTEQMRLPFVFALWASASSSLPDEIVRALQGCRDDGLQNLDAIIRDEAAKHGLTAADCRTYFTQQLHFCLGERELQGLELFRQHAAQLGLVPKNSKKLSFETT